MFIPSYVARRKPRREEKPRASALFHSAISNENPCPRRERGFVGTITITVALSITWWKRLYTEERTASREKEGRDVRGVGARSTRVAA